MEKAPWWGGYYERMVKLVKQGVRKILGWAQLRYEKFTTVPTEVEKVELATHHLSLFKRRWGTFNTFPPDHRKTTVNITKRKKVKWWRKHVDQPPVMRKIPQQVIGASLEEMVQRVLSRPEIILQRWLNKTSEKEDSNRIRCSHQGWWTTKIKLETCSSETTDGMQRRWNKSAVLRATTKKWTHATLRG